MRIAQDRLTIETAPREIKEITREIGGWVAGQQKKRNALTQRTQRARKGREGDVTARSAKKIL